jgi:3-methyladenine DNA glycosylase AlkD
MTTSRQIVARLKAMADPEAVAGMARYGIRPRHALGGASIPTLRKMAKELGSDHDLAQALWATGVHEARLLAVFIDDPTQVTRAQADAWAADFDSWDLCDQCCANLLDKTEFAHAKAIEWSERDEEFVKRAGFALMAALAVHDKEADDGRFLEFLPIIEREAGDDRNYVKKAVSWALRQIGKRNLRLNRHAIRTAQGMVVSGLQVGNRGEQGSRSAKWIASDVLRELTSEKVQSRLREHAGAA